MSPRPRSPGIAYGALALALLVVLATFALTRRDTPPPTIAEFAPQAVDQITESPVDQSSSAGGGGAGEAGDEAAASTPAPPGSASAINVPRVRKCVGDPPRQIEDPQSPPCVPYWAGDNGGATSSGVTRDEVRVAVPAYNADWHPVFEAFFNKRFEFYGRKMRLKSFANSNSCDPSVQTADAVTAHESTQSFASLNYPGCGGYFYLDEVSRRKVIAVSEYGVLTEKAMTARAPYLWQYPMGADRIFSNIGQWICGRLAGGNAVHAGDPAMRVQPRKYAVILDRVIADVPISDDTLTTRLDACGVRPAERFEINSSSDAGNYPGIVLKLKNSGVTSVICLCVYVASGEIAHASRPAGYSPEWLVSSYSLQDDNWYMRASWPSEQLESVFGLTMKPRQLRGEDQPVRAAQVEMKPGLYGPGDNSGVGLSALNREYRTMLLVASGMQMAGPRLTATSFEAALHKTVFPNPQTPLAAGRVGFADRDHSMTDDSAEFWWSNTARGPYADDAGTICYVAGGARHASGQWPNGGDPFFGVDCDSGAAL